MFAIIRSSEHVGIHWVLLEIIMSSRKIRVYDQLGTGKGYQQTLLRVISQKLYEEVNPKGKWQYRSGSGNGTSKRFL